MASVKLTVPGSAGTSPRAFPKSSDEPLLCHPECSDTCVCDVGADEDLGTRTKRFFNSFRMTHVHITVDYEKTLRHPLGCWPTPW